MTRCANGANTESEIVFLLLVLCVYIYVVVSHSHAPTINTSRDYGSLGFVSSSCYAHRQRFSTNTPLYKVHSPLPFLSYARCFVFSYTNAQIY